MEQNASWNFAEGDEIVPGRWAIHKLGGGIRFEVYLATDELLMQTVVVKLLRPDKVEESSSLRALRREVRVLRALAHPMIVRMFDVDVEGPRPHLVLEHVEGPTLRQLIRRSRRLPVEQVAPLALQLSSALHYMGRRGYVHLDVKPANIVMTVTPLLIDLSIARTVARAAALTDPVGTTTYMAPEQCVPGVYGHPGPASDVWGLGMTLYHSIEGMRPFGPGEKDAPTVVERYSQLREQPKPMAPTVPLPLREVVMDCLRKDPDARPTPAEVVERLEPLIGALPVRAKLRRGKPGR